MVIDNLAAPWILSAMLIAFYLATFTPTVVVLFPALLLMGGAALTTYLGAPIEQDPDVDEREFSSIFVYTLSALAAFAIAAVAAPLIPKFVRGEVVELSAVDAKLFGILMAVAEECFFRGAVVNYMYQRTDFMPAVFTSGALFTVYHFAVYGTDARALTYVFAAGVALAWVAIRSGRLSPAVIAHVMNNLFAFG